MEFRDLKAQYNKNKETIDAAIKNVVQSTHFIMGEQVEELERCLAEFVGVRHCISCANGTDALQLALMAWGIGPGDAVFVPDFTFFSSGEAVAALGATPVFVDVNEDTFNIDAASLEKMIKKTMTTKLKPRVVVAVDLFGQPAEYGKIRELADLYDLKVLEDGAQGLGGAIGDKKACSFGDIATTSFFPAKPLGCYGDGGAVFTDNDEWAELVRSFRVHGKGTSKYDNIRIGMNSRLDTIQAAILQAKLSVFIEQELNACDKIAKRYTEELSDIVKTPLVRESYFSSWAQYTIRMRDEEERSGLQDYLRKRDIPTAVYYQKPMHRQAAFDVSLYSDSDYKNTNLLCDTVVSLPIHPYMEEEQIVSVVQAVIEYLGAVK